MVNLLTLLLALVLATPAAGVVAYRDSTSVIQGAAATLTLSVPAATQNGDVLIASVGVRTNDSTCTDITPPAGWTLVGCSANGLTNPTIFAYYRIASSEPANYTWTLSASVPASGGIVAYSGVDPTTPVHVSAFATGDDPITAICTTPSITTSVANTQIVSACIARTLTNPTGVTSPVLYTQRWGNIISGSGVRHGNELSDVAQPAAGASGAQLVTFLGATNLLGYASFQLALQEPVNTPLVADTPTHTPTNTPVRRRTRWRR